jgi:nitroreductase
MELDKAIKERKSVRKYITKAPNWREIIEAIDAGLQGPLAGNIGSVRFILVSDRELIQQLKEACQEDFVATAHYVVVVCSDPKDVLRAYGERGEIYVRQQAGAAIENFLLKLVDLGLSGCWIGDFVEEQVKTTIRTPSNVYIEAVIPIGYSADKSVRKRKPSMDMAMYFDKYKSREMKPKKQVEAF